MFIFSYASKRNLIPQGFVGRKAITLIVYQNYFAPKITYLLIQNSWGFAHRRKNAILQNII